MYLFFVRHFNDIDHMTPIIWRLLKDEYPLAVYCMNPMYEIHNDYRLTFLRNQGATVDYLYEAFDRHGGIVCSIVQALYRKCGDAQIKLDDRSQRKHGVMSGLVGKIAHRLRFASYKLMRKWYLDEEWAHAILESTGAQVICFDHVTPKLYVVDLLMKVSRRMAIPSLALPHGVYLYTNDTTKVKSTDGHRLAKFNRFDYIVVTNQLRKVTLVRSGVTEDKVVVLGSARYCAEWMEQNRKILPGRVYPLSEESGKLKVVLMPSKPQCRLDVERMLTTCQTLADLKGVKAVIKPHTRVRSQAYLLDNVPLFDATHILTAELCDWADVLINVGSSVITEALMQGKPVLYLKYLHTNTTLFEELGACWTVDNETELKNALLSLVAEKNLLPYSKKSVTSFLREVVYGGNDSSDVLGRYERFIEECVCSKNMRPERTPES